MKYAHSYASHIEVMLRGVFGSDPEMPVYSVINADEIEKNLYVPIAFTLGYLYSKTESKKREIENFIENYYWYLEMGIRELLNFTTNERKIDDIRTIELGFENGKKALEKIIDELNKICG